MGGGGTSRLQAVRPTVVSRDIGIFLYLPTCGIWQFDTAGIQQSGNNFKNLPGSDNLAGSKIVATTVMCRIPHIQAYLSSSAII